MKLRKIIVAAALSLFMLSACTAVNKSGTSTNTNENNNTITNINNNTSQAAFKNISPKEAKENMAKDKNIILLDVRTQEEYNEEHIKGSTHLTLDRVEAEAQNILKDKNAVIYVYCRSGNRSVTASNQLIKLGYKNVYNLGGIKDWPYEKEPSK